MMATSNTSSGFKGVGKREFFILLGLALLVLLIRLPSLNQPFENDSSAYAYHARLITRGEPLYSSHHTGHHLPAVYYVYATAFALFGDQVSSVKAVLILWTIITVYLIYKLGNLVSNRRVGIISAVFASILSGQIMLAGTNSKRESFVMLPQVAAIFTALYLSQKRAPSWTFSLVGFFIAVSFLFKANYFFAPALVTGLVMLTDLWMQRRQVFAWKQFLYRGLAVSAGTIIPLVIVFGYFWRIGVGTDALAVFGIGIDYTGVVNENLANPAYLIIYPILILAANNAVLVVAGLAALIIIGVQTYVRLREHNRPGLILFIAIWFFACFVEAGASRVFLTNYYLIFVPSLSILVAWLVDHIAEKIPRPGLKRTMIIVTFFLVMLFIGLPQYRYMFEYGRFLLGIQTYDDFLSNGLPEGVGETMLALQEISNYISGHTDSDDTIYSWSNFMEFYYLTDRRSSGKIIWPIDAGTMHPREEIFTADYFIVGDVPLGYKDQPAWLWAGLEQDYILETTLHGQQIYRHK